MEQTIEALKGHIESVGYYSEIKFIEKSEDAIYFTVIDLYGDEAFVKADIDDELLFDDWNLWEWHNNSYWVPLDLK